MDDIIDFIMRLFDDEYEGLAEWPEEEYMDYK